MASTANIPTSELKPRGAFFLQSSYFSISENHSPFGPRRPRVAEETGRLRSRVGQALQTRALRPITACASNCAGNDVASERLIFTAPASVWWRRSSQRLPGDEGRHDASIPPGQHLAANDFQHHAGNFPGKNRGTG